MRDVKITCRCCKGSGTESLTGRYAETLALLEQQRRAVTGADLARLAGCSNEAMCNRLRALERMGLAVSRKDGRERHWQAFVQTDLVVS